MPKLKRVLKDSAYYRNYRKKVRQALNLPIREDVCADMGNESTANASDRSANPEEDNSNSSISHSLSANPREQASDCDSSGDEDPSGNEDDFGDEDDFGNEDPSGDEDAFDDEDGDEFDEELAEWLIKADAMGVSREHQNCLLRLLRKHSCFAYLPKDSRTITQRPKHVPVTNDSVYFGIESSLRTVHAASIENDLLELKVGIDGIPVHNDGRKCQLWPIVISTEEISPTAVSLWYGETKPPSVHEYLKDFLADLHNVQEHGVTIDGRHFEVVLKCIVADAPARAFLKQVKGHNARESCERCTVHGNEVNHTMCYTHQGDKKRDDEGYQQHAYAPGHQLENQTTPLVDYNIGLVSAFPLDYMHLVCLGVMRRFLKFMTKAKTEYKVSSGQWQQISHRLESYAQLMPSEFARRPRSLNKIDKFKATEFRQFLLYTGIPALKSIVHPDVFHTFLCLCIAMSILLNDLRGERRQRLDYARELLTHFVNNVVGLFGRDFVTYNVHNLLHISDDCDTFDCALDEVSAFPFESYLCQLKKRVKHSRNALVQIAKSVLTSRRKKKENVAPRSHRLRLSAEPRDRYFMTRSKDLCIVTDVLDDGKSFNCNIIRSSCLEDFFDKPCQSSFMDISYARRLKTTSHQRVIALDQVWRKLVVLPIEKGGFVLIPMLHHRHS